MTKCPPSLIPEIPTNCQNDTKCRIASSRPNRKHPWSRSQVSPYTSLFILRVVVEVGAVSGFIRLGFVTVSWNCCCSLGLVRRGFGV